MKKNTPVTERPADSLSTAAAYLAYEFAFAAGFVLLFTPYALFRMARAPAYREGIGQRLSLGVSARGEEGGDDPIWIQAVSVGEVKSVAPLIHRITSESIRPVHLTSITDTGHRLARELVGTKGTTAYFPIDFGPVVRRTLARVKPRAIVLFETEIWPTFIRAASSLRIPVSIVNGRISEKSVRRYRLLPWIFCDALSRISYAGMQSDRDAERIIALGTKPETVSVGGNMKFDATPSPPPPDEVERLRLELTLQKDDVLMVAGSTHEGEETAVLEIYRALLPKLSSLRLLLAPRHPERFAGVEALIRGAGFKVQRRSASGDGTRPNDHAVILLDTIGELARVYALASLTFVGGSLANVGGHNIIEPASMGKPVLFGPHMHHFEDIKEAFLSENAAVCVHDNKEFFETALQLLESPSMARSVGESARRVVQANRGATDRYFHALEKYL